MTVLAHIDWVKALGAWFVFTFLLMVAAALLGDFARWAAKRRQRRFAARQDAQGRRRLGVERRRP